MDPLSLFLALLAAALFGVVPHIQRAALPHTDIQTGAYITIVTGTVVFWAIAPFQIESSWWFTQSTLLFAVCGLFFPSFSQTLALKSVAMVGPNLNSAIGSSAPLFAAIFALVFLGESLGIQGAAGMGLLMLGLALAAMGPGKGQVRQWALWALLLPVGASFFRGIAQGITKLGFAEVPSAFFATLVMLSVSTLVLTLGFAKKSTRASARQNRKGNLIFALNGLVAGGGILALNGALSLGAVTVAAPLASTAPPWTFVYALFFFKTEQLSFRLLGVSLMVVAGAILIVTR